MRISVSIDDVIIDFDDDNPTPTIEGIESVLARLTQSAFSLYAMTFDLSTEKVFSIDFTPAEAIEDDEEDA